MKQYTKPSVREGHWETRARAETLDNIVEVKVQIIDNDWQDHYAVYVNGKRQRTTYFGESGHYAAARAFNDRVHWSQMITGDEL